MRRVRTYATLLPAAVFHTAERLVSNALLLAVLLTAAALLGGGCAARRASDGELSSFSGEIRDFIPAQVSAGIQLADGRYPSLFSGACSAAWLHPDMPMPNADAEEVLAAFGPHFLVLRVELESVFADMSIAYDAVGLRGVQPYLLTPQQKRVQPTQIIVGEELSEEQRGALRSFKRSNYLLFPREAARILVPWTGSPLESMRLVLDGFDSVFYFEWRPTTPETLPNAPLGELPAVDAARQQIRSSSRKTREFLHHFD